MVIAGILAAVILVALLARSRAKSDPKPERGIEPGQGEQLVNASYDSGGGGGHGIVVRVPKDPQEYAKIMTPKK
ncbi:hypothetical protein [Ruegeria arenilitoris]|uniref:hypothetical protein n=1 Tax=Ruegeria arenilitoris TaxID=1173585 RepID=UPI00147FE0F7|nr:hypothetical protein [Ruegeria arenilitoris]